MLNNWSAKALPFGWAMLWQSSLLILVLLAVDLVFRRRLRAVVRYVLWLVVLVKLVVPPSLAFPTGAGWWVRPRTEPTEVAPSKPVAVEYAASDVLSALPAADPPQRPAVSSASWVLFSGCSVSLILLVSMVVAWARLARKLRRTNSAPPFLNELLSEVRPLAGWVGPVRLMLTQEPVSPAVCGLFRPILVLPAELATRLPAGQLRLILLHELFHLRNRDAWVNCVQALLQIVYWWHPLLWLANARIRRVREEVVDDAVMETSRGDGPSYASTLLEVARMATERRLAALGLVGILESKRALRQRIERLLSFGSRQTGLTAFSIAAIAAFSAIAVPMGQAPPKAQVAEQVEVSQNGAKAQGFEYYPGNVLMNNGTIGAQSGTAPSFTGTDLPLAIIIQSDGTVRLGPEGTAVSMDQLKDAFVAAVGKATDRRLSISADTAAPFEQIVKVMDAAKEAGVGSAALTADKAHAEQAAQVVSADNLNADSGPAANSVRPFSSNPRQAIFRKLSEIRLEIVQFNGSPLSEVLKTLDAEAKRRDPEGKGINFILDPTPEIRQPSIDPTTGLPVTPASVESGLENVSVKLSLNDVRLIDVLDAIVKVADRRLQFTIENYGVIFRFREPGASPVPLFGRVFKVDPNTFMQGLNSVAGFQFGVAPSGSSGQSGGNAGALIPRVIAAPLSGSSPAGQAGGQPSGGIPGVTTRAMNPVPDLRDFFRAAGVELVPPKSAFLTVGEGTLAVRATKEDLDAVEEALAKLNRGELTFTQAASAVVPPRWASAEDRPRTIQEAMDRPHPTVVRIKPEENTVLIKVDQSTFLANVRRAAGLPATATTTEAFAAFRKMVADKGIELGEPKTIVFDERTGTLIVQASTDDVKAVKHLVDVLNQP